MACTTSSRSHGFTLVELLVVIGIIVVLISILLPSLALARKQALIVLERSNMRQVGLAVIMYAQDNKGRLPGGTGNAGCYPWTHDAVRTRLYGDPTKGGIAYLQPTWANIYGAPSSRLWGCTLADGIHDEFRYGLSWWWNAGCMNTCDDTGQSISCLPNFAGNWWEQPNLADGYALGIGGSGYQYDAGKRRPNPDAIVLLTDAGCAYLTWPAPHLRAQPSNYINDVEGANTLFLSGRVTWRTRGELQRVWCGGNYGYR